ncbi:MAG: hypothetical protein QNL62_09985 [Gammaproteobacteria bacterium]|nr:hypothetical protein [Gammaproteobacteria bacterium]
MLFPWNNHEVCTIDGVSFTEKALIELGEQIVRLQELVAQFKIELLKDAINLSAFQKKQADH